MKILEKLPDNKTKSCFVHFPEKKQNKTKYRAKSPGGRLVIFLCLWQLIPNFLKTEFRNHQILVEIRNHYVVILTIIILNSHERYAIKELSQI